MLNALRWCGHNISYKETISTSKEFGYDPKVGMSGLQLISALISKDIDHSVAHKIKLKDIIKEIDKDNSVILGLACSKDEDFHAVFVDKYTKKYIRTWNMTNYNKTPMLTRKKLSQFIRYSNRWRGGAYGIIIKGQQ
jgi:hypothetical protein